MRRYSLRDCLIDEARALAGPAERQAYSELNELARTWRKRNTAERVANALKAGAGLPFTEL